jgi:DNA polymerase-3 subunit beta
MKLSIERDELLRGLGRVQAIVERRGTMPILANVLIEARDDGLTLAATDLEVAVVARHTAKVKTPGSVTLGAKKLYEIARELEHPEVTLSADDARVTVTCGPAKFNLLSTSPEEYPSVPGVENATFASLDTALLAELIDHTLYAASTDETRYNLNGVFVESADGKKIRFVATDGYRISQIEARCRTRCRSWARASSCRARASPRSASCARRPTVRSSSASATDSCWCAGPISC